jgi:predicted acyl esterase
MTPHDQRDEDGGALVFETERLEEVVEICGKPTVTLDVAADQPVAMVAVRLIDVAPDDAATRVSYGLLNLTHRNSHAHPEPLEPGEPYRVTVDLKQIAQRFEVGHSIRLSMTQVRALAKMIRAQAPMHPSRTQGGLAKQAAANRGECNGRQGGLALRAEAALLRSESASPIHT